LRIRFSTAALRQIDKALAYIAERSPAGATKIEARLSTILMLLRLQPQAGLKTRLPRIRRIFLTPYPYLLDYDLGDDEIVILRFRHTSRSPASIPERM
jgi:plasmid stabilization system protein ParE